MDFMGPFRDEEKRGIRGEKKGGEERRENWNLRVGPYSFLGVRSTPMQTRRVNVVTASVSSQ